MLALKISFYCVLSNAFENKFSQCPNAYTSTYRIQVTKVYQIVKARQSSTGSHLLLLSSLLHYFCRIHSIQSAWRSLFSNNKRLKGAKKKEEKKMKRNEQFRS